VTNTFTNETYVLYQCGSSRPSGSVTAGAKVFEIPLTSVSVPDTVPYAFLVSCAASRVLLLRLGCISRAACGLLFNDEGRLAAPVH
jgi:hypothetical protein